MAESSNEHFAAKDVMTTDQMQGDSRETDVFVAASSSSPGNAVDIEDGVLRLTVGSADVVAWSRRDHRPARGDKVHSSPTPRTREVIAVRMSGCEDGHPCEGVFGE